MNRTWVERRGAGARPIVLVIWLTLVAGPAQAQSLDGPASGPAHDLWVDGVSLWHAGEFARAADRFDRAYEIEHLASMGVWVARSLRRSGQLIRALGLYREVSALNVAPDAPAKEWQAKLDAAVEAERLLGVIPRVSVIVEASAPESVVVTLNGQVLGKDSLGLGMSNLVDAGRVEVRAVAGNRVAESSVVLAEGDSKTVELSFRQLAPQASPRHENARAVSGRNESSTPGATQRALSYVAFGVGGAALLTGGVFGLLSLGDRARLQGECAGTRCPPRLASDIDLYESRKTISAIGLLSGTALLAAGAALYFSAPSGRTDTSVQVGVGSSGPAAVVRGVF